MTQEEMEAKWTAHAAQGLVGKTITSIAYMTQQEADEMGWSSRPLKITLDDGTSFYAQSDDEGNNGGALFHEDGLDVFPTL